MPSTAGGFKNLLKAAIRNHSAVLSFNDLVLARRSVEPERAL